MKTQTNNFENLNRLKLIEITDDEARQTLGGGWLSNLYDGIVAACCWVDYQIRDFKDDHRFNKSASIF
jgi:hypothetical protein